MRRLDRLKNLVPPVEARRDDDRQQSQRDGDDHQSGQRAGGELLLARPAHARTVGAGRIGQSSDWRASGAFAMRGHFAHGIALRTDEIASAAAPGSTVTWVPAIVTLRNACSASTASATAAGD